MGDMGDPAQALKEKLVRLRINIMINNEITSLYKEKSERLINLLYNVIKFLNKKLKEIPENDPNAEELVKQIAELKAIIEKYKQLDNMVARADLDVTNQISRNSENIKRLNKTLDFLRGPEMGLSPELVEELNGIAQEFGEREAKLRTLSLENHEERIKQLLQNRDLDIDRMPGEELLSQYSARGGKNSKSKRRKSRMMKYRTRKQMRGCSQKGSASQKGGVRQKGGFIAIFDQTPSSPTKYLSGEKNKSKIKEKLKYKIKEKSKDKHRSKKHHQHKHKKDRKTSSNRSSRKSSRRSSSSSSSSSLSPSKSSEL